jgi:CheY-like chemotaxis protein
MAEAERASAAKTEFLSRMSHELRTPLNAILGFGQLLELAPLPESEGGHARHIVRAGEHLLALINEVLDLATVESGRIDLELQPVALRALIDECVALVQPAARQAELTIDCRVHADCLPVRADRGRLKQVLINLLSNAVKYNRPGGEVVIDCHCEQGGLCEVRVTDTGPGLDAEQLARLFQPFERLAARETAIEGTGIGLSVCKRLTEAMGGQIGAFSEPARGSRFWLRLPTVTAGPEPLPPDHAPSAADNFRSGHTARRFTVLLVEDNLANLRLMQHIFVRRRDLDLISTTDPRQALALAQRHQPQLLLLDIQLPHLDGYQLLDLLRQAGITTPVVAVSANAMPADVARAVASGFDDYLSKPIDIQRLLATIDRLLPERPAVTAS